LHHQILIVHDRLAGKPRLRFQPPGLVQQVLFLLFGGRQRVIAFAHYDMAGRAGAGLFAGMVDVYVVFKQVVADGHPAFGFKLGAFRTKLGVGQNDDLGHVGSSMFDYISRELSFLPASARLTEASMRRAAKAWVAWFNASAASWMAWLSLPSSRAFSLSTLA